jgi:hypothetical protein
MCFAMPLRSARRFVGFHGDPADDVGEVKVCDKAQRFGSIANGSPLNEARRGALNPAGGTFLGENGQIENHVCL